MSQEQDKRDLEAAEKYALMIMTKGFAKGQELVNQDHVRAFMAGITYARANPSAEVMELVAAIRSVVRLKYLDQSNQDNHTWLVEEIEHLEFTLKQFEARMARD